MCVCLLSLLSLLPPCISLPLIFKSHSPPLPLHCNQHAEAKIATLSVDLGSEWIKIGIVKVRASFPRATFSSSSQPLVVLTPTCALPAFHHSPVFPWTLFSTGLLHPFLVKRLNIATITTITAFPCLPHFPRSLNFMQGVQAQDRQRCLDSERGENLWCRRPHNSCQVPEEWLPVPHRAAWPGGKKITAPFTYTRCCCVAGAGFFALLTQVSNARPQPIFACFPLSFSFFFFFNTQQVDSVIVQRYKEMFPEHNIEADPTRNTVLFRVDDDTVYSVEELVAMMLQHVVELGAEYAGVCVCACGVCVCVCLFVSTAVSFVLGVGRGRCLESEGGDS